MLVRIRHAREAAQAAAAGVDVVELAMAGAEADLAEAEAVRAAFPGSVRLRFDDDGPMAGALASAAKARADEVAVSVGAALGSPFARARLDRRPEPIALVGAGPDDLRAIEQVRDHVGGVMVDADGRLIDAVPIAHLDSVASACRANGLRFGLAGGLEAPDVSRLLLLAPDVLAFDTAVRDGHRADGALDPSALDAIRGLIPRGAQARVAHEKVEVVDRIFVRDFVVPLAIGAYQAEHGARQRVRFCVEAEVIREPIAPRDMRDVFSYDIIVETIRVLAEREHVSFVETLAEDVAATLLTHPEVVGVSVKVEKLDVIDGIVGIETTRRRPR